MIKSEELTQMKARAEDTTFKNAYVKDDLWKGYEVKCEGNGTIIAELPCETDADFIAHARQDVPRLVAEVEKKAEQSAFWYTQFIDMVDVYDDNIAEIERLRAALETVQNELFAIRGVDSRHDSDITGICTNIGRVLNGGDYG